MRTNKKYIVEAFVTYEGYSGHDYKTTLIEKVKAMSKASAEKKARKVFEKSPYVARGIIDNVKVKEENHE